MIVLHEVGLSFWLTLYVCNTFGGLLRAGVAGGQCSGVEGAACAMQRQGDITVTRRNRAGTIHAACCVHQLCADQVASKAAPAALVRHQVCQKAATANGRQPNNLPSALASVHTQHAGDTH